MMNVVLKNSDGLSQVLELDEREGINDDEQDGLQNLNKKDDEDDVDHKLCLVLSKS